MKAYWSCSDQYVTAGDILLEANKLSIDLSEIKSILEVIYWIFVWFCKPL